MRMRCGQLATSAKTAALGAALLVGAMANPLAAADDAWDKELEDYDRQREELRAMVAARDTGWFEVDFQPLSADRILLKDGAEVERVFHYVTYRLRNRVSDNAQFLIEHASNFNEVMDSIVKEHEHAVFDPSGEDGPQLRIDDVEAIEDPGMATIIDRPDLKQGERVVNITVIAYDEDGTRFRLFDPVYQGEAEDGEWVFDPDQQAGPQQAFDFPDHGNTRYGITYQRVREAIEEEEGRRLLSVHQVRDRQLAPYNPQVRDAEGVAQGELYGVIIFDRLPTTGDEFTVQVQGLSNKLRFQGMQVQQGTPENAGEVQDYFNARILRRTFQLTVERPGDEFFLDQAPLEIADARWVWEGAFNRIQRRSTMAYAKFFLDNIALDEERQGPDGPVLHNEEVNQAFLQYWDQAIANVEARYQADLEEVQQAQERTRKHYEQWLAEDDLGSEFIQERYDQRMQHLQEREAAIEAAIDELPQELAEIRKALADAQQ